MNKKHKLILIFTTILIIHISPVSSLNADAPPVDPPTRIVISVHPANEPVPALKHRLLPRPINQRPGNAAIHYMRASMNLQRNDQFNEDIQKISMDWGDLSLSELPINELRTRIARYNSVLDQLQAASLYEDCNWETTIREDGFMALLPHLSQMRTLARLLDGRIRLAIAEKRFDDAIADIRVGYTLARHVGDADTLIEGLVGVAIARMMSNRIEEMAQQPDAPSMYWALASLPSPLIELRNVMRWEGDSLFATIPDLKHVRDDDAAVDWARLLKDTYAMLGMLGINDGRLINKDLGGVAMAVTTYTHSKQYLVNAGYTEEQIEAMPTARVTLLAMIDRYEVMRDDMFRWYNFPYWQAEPHLIEAERKLETAENNLINMLGRTLLPSVRAAALNMARAEAHRSLVIHIEAIRLYAGEHDGSLPPSLDAMNDTLLPINPITGVQFDYRVENDTAILELPAAPGRSEKEHVIYEITITK